nr:Tol-Pal system beta propeller repeat protein TolB [Halocynthiibacter namhaensis]
MTYMSRIITRLFAFLILAVTVSAAHAERLVIDLSNPRVEPVPLAVPSFVAENSAANEYAQQIAQVVAADLVGTGLFRQVSQDAFISNITSFEAPVQYADWRAINVEGLISGAVTVTDDGGVNVKFRVYDIATGAELGSGLQLGGTTGSWRRLAHKVADTVYSRITGEGAYFDSRVVYVSEAGPKDNRRKRLAVMDYDGANLQYLTDSSDIVLAPRFSPTGDRVLYTSYETGTPQVFLLDVGSVQRRALGGQDGAMTFAPRFGPNGNTVVFSSSTGGNTDIFTVDLRTGARARLTSSPSIETSPSFSPDGSQIVFESDRSGSPQLYVMSASGGEARRISFGNGRYGTPVWSPRGDLVAFTKQNDGRFHIGVMRTDGSEERLLTVSFLDEGPTWSPNGRVIMFMRETSGAEGQASLYSVDISGRNLRRVNTEGSGSDPAWSPLLP